MKLSRQIKRAQERRRHKEQKSLLKQLQLSEFTYVADDKNMTFCAMAPELIDFFKVIGLAGLLKDHVHIDKRQSTYNSDKLS